MFLPSLEDGTVDRSPDLLNTSSYAVTECLQIPPDTTPAEAAASIVSYFKCVKRPWPDKKLKELGEYIINQCNDSVLESTREIVVSHFADLLGTDQTTLLTSGRVHRSFTKTLGSEDEYENLSFKLNEGQALYIAKAVLGKASASNLKHDSFSRCGSVERFSFNVINTICQSKGQYYTIQEFLDQLENPGFSN